MNLTKKELLNKIKGMTGTVPAVSNNFQSRKNDDGQFGRLLEESLGIKENNSQNADVSCLDGDVELKTHNADSTTNITLMSKEPKWNKSEGFNNWHDVVRTFPTSDEDGTIRCYTTIGNTPNNKGLSVYVDEDDKKVKIMDLNQRTVGSWSFDMLQNKLDKKCGDSVIVVLRNTKNIVLGADVYSGGDFDNMKEMLRDGRMVVEIRAKTGATKHNHGTGFRLDNNYMPDLFSGVSA
jgi:hypothetical protein